MFGTNHLGNGAWVHPTENIQSFGTLSRHDAVEHRIGFVVTQGQAHDLVYIVGATQSHAVLLFQHINELVEHHIHRVLRQTRSLHHGCTQGLNFLGTEVFHYLCGLFLAEQKHQHRSALGGRHRCHLGAQFGGPLNRIVISHVISLVP